MLEGAKGLSKKDKFIKAVEVWLHSEPSFWVAKQRRLLSWWYNLDIPRIDALRIASLCVTILIATAAPALMYFIYGRITLVQALMAAVVLMLLKVTDDTLRGIRLRRLSANDEKPNEIWVRMGDLLNSVQSSAADTEDVQSAITACLGIIELYATQETGSKRGEIAVSLVLYDPADRARMTIKHRNPGAKRPLNRVVRNLDKLFGHHACSAGPAPRIVDDVLSFGRDAVESPTQSQVNYRSIFIIPIEPLDGEAERIAGFISIDSERPFAFYGRRSTNIAITCTPFIDFISHLVEERTNNENLDRAERT